MPQLRKLLKKKLINFPTKIRIFIPILTIIIISVAAITYYSIYVSKKNLYNSLENYLTIEVQSLLKMFEREYELKLENAKKDLKVIHEFFYQRGFFISDEMTDFDFIDPVSGEKETITVNKWYLGETEIHNRFDFVDKILTHLGSTATIFQKTDRGYVRISTNVMTDAEQRAVGTVIPFDSAIARTIESGKSYFGRAYVVNDWFITGYEPIRYKGETVGMLFVGTKEKDLPVLSKKFKELNIGESGYPFVFDNSGKMVINHSSDDHNWTGLEVIDQIISEKKGVVRYLSPVDNKRKIIAFNYFPEFDFYICAFVNKEDETRQLISNLVYGSVIVSFIIILIISFTVYFMTIEKLHSYLETLENRNKEITSIKEALKHSEKLATMGQLSAGIAHEVNNPLGVVLMYSHILMEECDPGSDMYKDLETIATQANRCKTILSGLLNFARKNEINKKEMTVRSFIDSARKSMLVPQTVKLSVNYQDPEHVVALDENQMTQVLVNLFNNSVDAIKSSGEIKINVNSDSEFVSFSIEDNGPGITEENQKRLFEPFFSTKQMGKGTGLGLAVCYGIVKMHSGKIIVESNADEKMGPTYARFVIKIPAK
ncbi:MAG: Cache 3/Cache 2 fusion domain-containing protein [Candidatus Delongbacteria bacterium]|nr:Cache 3/Cache 2 fusion domain-containing protein [Candidatus Delongbacteria bacterium]